MTAPGRYKPFLLVLTSASSPFFNLLLGEFKGAKIRGYKIRGLWTSGGSTPLFFDKEGKGSSDAEPEADGLRSRVPDQVYIGELDEVKNDCLFSMIVDTRGGGRGAERPAPVG